MEMSPGHGKNTSTEKGKARDGGGKRKKKKEMGDISRACFFFPLLLSPASLTFSPPPLFSIGYLIGMEIEGIVPQSPCQFAV